MSQTTKQLAVRLPLDLHAKIVATAAANNRSGHAEMLHRLEASFSEPASAGPTMVEAAELTEVFTTCFSSLEERVLAMLDHPMRHIYSVSIPHDELSKEDLEALRDQLKGEGAYSQLGDLYQRHFQNFDLRGRPCTTSPTGRLSESQPEISGLHTLGSALPKRQFHTGGFCGWPAGEPPKILEKGEPVIQLSEWEQRHGRGTRKGFPDPGPVTVTILDQVVKIAKPLTDQTWVITGSLETMTRDRAREIIMELGGIVAGAVVPNATHRLLWGPGAGSKKVKAEQYGVQQYTERQFIELIRGHGVDMPLPIDEETWIENPGYCPVAGGTLVSTTMSSGKVDTDYARNFDWRRGASDKLAVRTWRLAK